MSAEHTPGPWSCFYKHKYDEWHVSLPVAGSSMKLALAPDGIQSHNREADARLIAAAPDMLVALIQARGALRLDAMVDDAGKPFGTTTVALGYIDAAIAKARAT